MRNQNTLPAWATRLRNRRLERRVDGRVVRWIAVLKRKALAVARSGDAPDGSSNDNDGILAVRAAS